MAKVDRLAYPPNLWPRLVGVLFNVVSCHEVEYLIGYTSTFSRIEELHEERRAHHAADLKAALLVQAESRHGRSPPTNFSVNG